MKIFSFLIATLLSCVLFSQSYQSLSTPSFQPKNIDYSGTWSFIISDDKYPIRNEEFIITIKENNGKYSGHYCRKIENGKKNDCPNDRNLTITQEDDFLHLLLLSEWGGMVKGKLSVHDPQRLKWQAQEKFGASFIPNSAILNSDGKILYKMPKLFLELPINSQKLPAMNKSKLAETSIRLKTKTQSRKNSFIAEIDNKIGRFNTYILSDCTTNYQCNHYFLTLNPEGKEIDRLPLTLGGTNAINSKEYEKLISYSIHKDFSISMNYNLYKKDKLKGSAQKKYTLNNRGNFELNP